MQIYNILLGTYNVNKATTLLTLRIVLYIHGLRKYLKYFIKILDRMPKNCYILDSINYLKLYKITPFYLTRAKSNICPGLDIDCACIYLFNKNILLCQFFQNVQSS